MNNNLKSGIFEMYCTKSCGGEEANRIKISWN